MEVTRGSPKLALIVAAVALALGSQAQEPRENANRPGESTQVARSDAGMQTLDQYLQSNTLRVSKLAGMEVQNRSGDNLGQVEDVIRGAGPGQDVELVVQISGGGAGGAGDEKLVSISFDDIQINADGDELYTTRTREELAAAPAVALERRTTGNQPSPAQRAADDDNDTRTTQPGAAAGNRGAATASTSANDRRLADLVGAEVTGANGDSVGEVDDIVISMAGANRLRAVLQVGGIAGVGEKRVAVPFNELTVERTGDGSPSLRIAMDQDALERLPEFEYEDDTAAL